MAAELHVQLMNELLRDNDTLTKAISMATQEKAELCRTVSRLEKTLKHHMQKGCILSVRIFVSSWHSLCPLSLYTVLCQTRPFYSSGSWPLPRPEASVHLFLAGPMGAVPSSVQPDSEFQGLSLLPRLVSNSWA